LVLQVPDRLRLKTASIERIWRTPAVNRREIFKRDKYQCQYCGSRQNLTLDHLIPRCRGGSHSWDNLVTACQPCNGKKGDRTPEQAGMILKNPPKAPLHPTLLFAEQFWQSLQGES
jgi:5-methylcytosine-specific restriction endonuclease McrA